MLDTNDPGTSRTSVPFSAKWRKLGRLSMSSSASVPKASNEITKSLDCMGILRWIPDLSPENSAFSLMRCAGYPTRLYRLTTELWKIRFGIGQFVILS